MKEDGETNLAARARELLLQVAIDGPAGAGKTTVGSGLARNLMISMLDTGLMYRAVAEAVLALPAERRTADAAAEAARTMGFDLRGEGDQSQLLAGDEPLHESELHRPDIDGEVPVVAAMPEVRTVLVEAQQRLAAGRAIVMLGRDIGTVVLPSARVKLYVTADDATRAARRRLDRPQELDLLRQIQSRDSTDAGRTVSPMRPAGDAICLDTTSLSVDESIRTALAIVNRKLRSKGAAK